MKITLITVSTTILLALTGFLIIQHSDAPSLESTKATGMQRPAASIALTGTVQRSNAASAQLNESVATAKRPASGSKADSDHPEQITVAKTATEMEAKLAAAMPVVSAQSSEETKAESISRISREWGIIFGRTTTELQRALDENSARNALPSLNTISSDFAALTSRYQTLPEKLQRTLSPVIDKRLTKLNEQTSEVYEQAGTESILKPVLSPLIESLNALVES